MSLTSTDSAEETAAAIERGRAIADAWRNGRWLEAYRLLSEMWPKISEPAKAYSTLREIVSDQRTAPLEADPDAQKAEARKLLTQKAAKVKLPRLSPARRQTTLEDLARMCAANPRLDWLAESVNAVLATPTHDEPLKVAVLGVFNSGKSTLINALLGHDLLRTGIIPVTASLTELRWAEKPVARVRFFDGSERVITLDELAALTDEREGANPAKTVERVTIGYPAELLKRFTLLDTPGFNSGYDLHELVTERVILDADVVLWLFNATRAGSETEARELLHVERSVGKTIGVVNHIDDLDPSWKRNPDGWQKSLEGVLADLKSKLGRLIERWVPISALWMSRESAAAHAEAAMWGVSVGKISPDADHPDSGRDAMLAAMADLAERAVAIQKVASEKHRKSILQVAVALRGLQKDEQAGIDKHRQEQAQAESEFLKQAKADWQEELELWRRSHKPIGAIDWPQSDAANVLDKRRILTNLPGEDRELLPVAMAAFRKAAFMVQNSALGGPWRVVLRGAAAAKAFPVSPRFWLPPASHADGYAVAGHEGLDILNELLVRGDLVLVNQSPFVDEAKWESKPAAARSLALPTQATSPAEASATTVKIDSVALASKGEQPANTQNTSGLNWSDALTQNKAACPKCGLIYGFRAGKCLTCASTLSDNAGDNKRRDPVESERQKRIRKEPANPRAEAGTAGEWAAGFIWGVFLPYGGVILGAIGGGLIGLIFGGIGAGVGAAIGALLGAFGLPMQVADGKSEPFKSGLVVGCLFGIVVPLVLVIAALLR